MRRLARMFGRFLHADACLGLASIQGEKNMLLRKSHRQDAGKDLLQRALSPVSDFSLCWMVFGGAVVAYLVLSSSIPRDGMESALLTKASLIGVWIGVTIATLLRRPMSGSQRRAA